MSPYQVTIAVFAFDIVEYQEVFMPKFTLIILLAVLYSMGHTQTTAQTSLPLIAFATSTTCNTVECSTQNLLIYDLNTGNTQVIAENVSIYSLAWSYDHTLLAFSDGKAKLWDSLTGEITELPESDAEIASSFVWSHNDRQLFYLGRASEKLYLYRYDLEAQTLQQFMLSEYEFITIMGINLTKDGQRIILSMMNLSAENITNDLFVYHLDTQNMKLLLQSDQSNEFHPMLSEDEQKVLFRSDSTGAFQIYLLDIATKAVLPLTTDQEAKDRVKWFGNDRVLYRLVDERALELIDVATGEVRRVFDDLAVHNYFIAPMQTHLMLFVELSEGEFDLCKFDVQAEALDCLDVEVFKESVIAW
jgi:WD40 repeat protein